MIHTILRQCLHEMGLEVSDSNQKALTCFASELKKWNRKINLTAITTDEDIAVKHIVDSFFVSKWVSGATKILDIGSGAGVPAIPLKILLPGTHMISVDSVSKKITFQRHVIRLLGLQGFDAIHARVESLRDTHAGYFDAVISRAFSRLDTFVALAAPLLAGGGRLYAMKGPAASEEITDGMNVIHGSGFLISEIHTYVLPRNKGERRLVVLSAAKIP
jgi:16S rRNA (guanine527-N7)-methyltransferase